MHRLLHLLYLLPIRVIILLPILHDIVTITLAKTAITTRSPHRQPPRIPHLPLELLQRAQLARHEQTPNQPVQDARAETERADQRQDERDIRGPVPVAVLVVDDVNGGWTRPPHADEAPDGDEHGEQEVREAPEALCALAPDVFGDHGQDVVVGFGGEARVWGRGCVLL